MNFQGLTVLLGERYVLNIFKYKYYLSLIPYTVDTFIDPSKIVLLNVLLIISKKLCESKV